MENQESIEQYLGIDTTVGSRFHALNSSGQGLSMVPQNWVQVIR